MGTTVEVSLIGAGMGPDDHADEDELTVEIIEDPKAASGVVALVMILPDPSLSGC